MNDRPTGPAPEILTPGTASRPERELYVDWLRPRLPKRWEIPDHLVAIGEHLDAVDRGEITRLMINMPPRHAKTETVTVRFPLFWWEGFDVGEDGSLIPRSGHNILTTGFNQRFANRLSRKTRTLAEQFGFALRSDQLAVDEWARAMSELRTEGGTFMARGVGSPPTGTGFRLIMIDDPIRRRKDADSAVFRDGAWDWYTDDLYTRLEPGGALIMTLTRWHEDDVAARAIAAANDTTEPFTILKLPAIDAEGKALWPKRYPVPALFGIRKILRKKDGERSWQALYQQNPVAAEGDLFKTGKLLRVMPQDVAPGLDSVVAFDIAYSQDKGDFTAVGQVWDQDPNVEPDVRRYSIDGARIKLGPTGELDENEEDIGLKARDEWIVNQVLSRPCRKVIVPQDPAAGKVEAVRLQSMIRRALRAAHRTETKVVIKLIDRNKVANAGGLASQMDAKGVQLVKGAFEDAINDEMTSFPAVTNDDLTDAIVLAYNQLAAPDEETGMVWEAW